MLFAQAPLSNIKDKYGSWFYELILAVDKLTLAAKQIIFPFIFIKTEIFMQDNYH